VKDDRLWNEYAGWLTTLHPTVREEVQAMAQKIRRKSPIDLRPVIEMLGVSAVIDQVGLDRVIDQVGLDRVIAKVGKSELMERILPKLSPAERRALKRRLEARD
jgi:hypothetical protein